MSSSRANYQQYSIVPANLTAKVRRITTLAAFTTLLTSAV